MPDASIRTLILDEPGRFRADATTAPPQPGPGEALVRVRRVGICGTDIHAYHGRQPFFSYPRILGHELGVEVVAVGSDVQHLAPGDCCAVEPYLNCGMCIACRQGRTNCCARLQVLGVHIDGGMREQISVPAHKLHRSATLDLEQLALVETLAIGAHAVQRAQVQAGEWVLVIGAGPIGLGVIQFAHLAGAQVVALDMSASRLAFCRQQGLADVVIHGQTDPLPTLRELTSGDLPTVVFDATGNQASMERAFEYTAPGARLIFVGLVQQRISFSDPEFHRRELSILATRNALAADFTRIIGQIEAGQIDTRPWITHHAPFETFPADFPDWLQADSGLVKGIMTF